MGSLLDLAMLKDTSPQPLSETERLRQLITAHETFVKRIDELVDGAKTDHVSEWAIVMARDELRQQQKQIRAFARGDDDA